MFTLAQSKGESVRITEAGWRAFEG